MKRLNVDFDTAEAMLAATYTAGGRDIDDGAGLGGRPLFLLGHIAHRHQLPDQFPCPA